jgi:hypothetical protein
MPVLSNTVRIAGECRTYRIAATVAPEKDSGGALLLRTGLFHLATTRMTPKNDTKFATKAVATPATYDRASERRPNRSGEVEFNPIKRRSRCQVFLGHQFREDCTPCRRFERISGRERKCEHQQYPRRHHSCDGQDRKNQRDAHHPGLSKKNQLPSVDDIASGARWKGQ